MEIALHDRLRRPVGRVRVDPAARPVRVKATADDGSMHDAFLEWERAVDDAGQLRACVACGCQRLYRRKTLPRMTPFVLVLAALVILLALDIAVLFVARTQLVCYRCGTSYAGLRIARYHRPWDARTAQEPDARPDAPDAQEGAPT